MHALPPRKKKLFLLGLIPFLAGLLMGAFGVIAYLTTPTTGFLTMGSVGVALTVFGIICLFFSYVRLEWRIEDREDQQLAEVKQVSKLFAKFQVLAPDGDVIAHIHKKRGLAGFRYSYSIDIIRQVLDSRFIISFAILRADMDKAVTSAAPIPTLVI